MRILFIITLVIITLGCTTTELKTLQSVQDTIYEVSNGNILYDIKSVELSSTDLIIVDHSFNKLTAFIERWKELPKDNLTIFLSEYSEVRNSYLSIHRVVDNNWNKYTESNREKLLKYKQEAILLDNSVKQMIRIKNYYRAGKLAISVIEVALGLVK